MKAVCGSSSSAAGRRRPRSRCPRSTPRVAPRARRRHPRRPRRCRHLQQCRRASALPENARAAAGRAGVSAVPCPRRARASRRCPGCARRGSARPAPARRVGILDGTCLWRSTRCRAQDLIPRARPQGSSVRAPSRPARPRCGRRTAASHPLLSPSQRSAPAQPPHSPTRQQLDQAGAERSTADLADAPPHTHTRTHARA